MTRRQENNGGDVRPSFPERQGNPPPRGLVNENFEMTTFHSAITAHGHPEASSTPRSTILSMGPVPSPPNTELRGLAHGKLLKRRLTLPNGVSGGCFGGCGTEGIHTLHEEHTMADETQMTEVSLQSGSDSAVSVPDQ